MSYVNGQHDVALSTSAGVPIISTTGGLVLRWSPGYQPVRVVALSVVNTTTLTPAIAPVISFWESSDVGAASGSWTAIDTITFTTAGTTGSVFFVEGLSTRIEPGNEITANITTVSTEAVLIRASAYVEADQEAHQNNSAMTESA